MKKITVILIVFLFFTSCSTPIPAQPSAPSAKPAELPTPAASAPPETTLPSILSDGSDLDRMKKLMPAAAGFQWQYFGIAEYAMTMSLKSVEQKNGAIDYWAEGAVADMSDGEAKGDFSVKIAYSVTPDSLSQRLEGEKALDNTFPDIELLRAPLEAGTQWVQAARNSKGQDRSLSCSITDIQTIDGRKVYFVTYQDEESDYYEKREITEGRGVTAFDKLYEFESLRDLIGYRYYAPETTPALEGYEQWLPVLGTEYTFFGLAEYGHKGVLVKLYGNDAEDVYEYRGVYSDGIGTEDRFVVRYYADKKRGTITESAVSNERDGAEVNSKLHNLVILKFPLGKGETWEHSAKLNGKPVTVRAEVVELDEEKGVAKVRYTAGSAEGYYTNTYIEERTFEKGYGMTGFGNLMPGGIGIAEDDAKNTARLADAIAQHMFGYSMNKSPNAE